MDVFSGVICEAGGGHSFSALVQDEDAELEICGRLGDLVCSILNQDYGDSIDPVIKKYEKYYAAARKPEKSRLFFYLDRLEKIKKKFMAMDTQSLRELVDLVFVREEENRCPISQKLFYYGYFLGGMQFSAQLTLLGGFEQEPQIPENPDPAQLRRLFDSACEGYRPEKQPPAAEYSYRLHSIEDLVKCCLFEMARHEVRLRKCANCARYFIPLNRSDTFYCEHASPQDPARTCRQYNSEHLWYDRLKNNEALKLCRNIASAKQMLAKRNPENSVYAEDLKRFRMESKKWKTDFLAGRKSQMEFIAWLEENRGKKKK